MKNLFEELQRIKSLMVYEQGVKINEVSTASVEGGDTDEGDGGSENQNKPADSENEKNNVEQESKTEGGKEPSKKNCVSITNTEVYKTESDVNKEVPEKFFQKFKQKVEEQFGLFADGEFTIEDINVFGGASNYWKGSNSNKFPAVEPKYCNEYDVNVGITSLKTWSSGCKGFGKTEKKVYDKNSSGKKSNEDLAKRRAQKVLDELTKKIVTFAQQNNIKVPADFKKEIKNITSGSIYTEDKTDTHSVVAAAIKSGELNAGQLVMIDAVLCFTPYNPCPNCMIRDPKTKQCKCKEGLTEKDGKCFCPNGKEVDENCECNNCPDPCMTFNKETKKCDCPEGMTFNESTKQCECPKGFKKTDDCECLKEKERECPDKCQKRDENGDCKCPNGMTFNEETQKCDCPEGKIKPTVDACNCVTPKPPLKCGYNEKKEGGRGTKQNNFVAATVKSGFPVGEGDTVTISFDSLVVPDAFYVKYGDQEFFSGFMGDVYNDEYRQVALSVKEKKKMLPLQSKYVKDIVKDELNAGDNDYSGMDNVVRNFVGELVMYKRQDGLLESINEAIKSEGGKLTVKDIFKNGDAEAEKITDDIINSGSIKDNIVRYKQIMKSGTSFKITKEEENFQLIIMVFSPLDRTIFTMEVKCE
jgi:hypothetical protein